MVRRDTGPMTFRPKVKGTGEYLLTNGAVLYFTLRKERTSEVLLEKYAEEIENGIGTISIESEDTEDLEPGTYVYDLVLIRTDGTRDTLLPEGRDTLYFAIKEGVKQGQ